MAQLNIFCFGEVFFIIERRFNKLEKLPTNICRKNVSKAIKH